MKEEMILTDSPAASCYNNCGGWVGGSNGSGFNNHSNPDVSRNNAVVLKKKRSTRMRYDRDMSIVHSSGDLGSSSGNKCRIGRPPGTGWKQQLALFGEWMTNSAGMAFMPHAIYVDAGEDVAYKILSFVKKGRALCILSACGSVSEVTLQKSICSKGPVTFEGRFDIVCLSGSYLPAETGGSRNRTGGSCNLTGGINISLSDPVGQVVGGAIGGKLIAATPVQVVAFSFRYDGKPKNKPEAPTKSEISCDEKPSVQVMAPPSQG